MTGTEKQVKWATELKEQEINHVKKLESEAVEWAGRNWGKNSKELADMLATIAEKMIEGLNKVENASWFIDNCNVLFNKINAKWEHNKEIACKQIPFVE